MQRPAPLLAVLLVHLPHVLPMERSGLSWSPWLALASSRSRSSVDFVVARSPLDLERRLSKAALMSVLRLVSVVLLVLPLAAKAQQSGPVGSPIPGAASGGRSELTPDPDHVGKPWDPSLSEIDRVDASIRLRADTGADKEDCHYGPVERRVSDERIDEILIQTRYMDPAEKFQALMDEPEDPSVSPRPLMIYAPYTYPLPKGVVCPRGDVTAKLLAERERLIRQGQVPSQPLSLREMGSDQSPYSSAELEAKRIEGGPVMLLSFNPDVSELQIIEAIMRSRARRGLDKLSNCYYGPGQFRISRRTVSQYLNEHPNLPGDEYWAWFNEQPQDPKALPFVILVRWGTLPDCPAGDLDARLERRRAELRGSQGDQQ